MVDTPQPIAIAYATLRMDKGEDLKYAAESIGRYTAQNPVAFFYDIICTKGQLETAHVYIDDIRTLVAEMNPTISDSLKMFAITTDEMNRPAALHMYHLFGNAPIKDLNPKREEGWNG